jgi:hypothetical protein
VLGCTELLGALVAVESDAYEVARASCVAALHLTHAQDGPSVSSFVHKSLDVIDDQSSGARNCRSVSHSMSSSDPLCQVAACNALIAAIVLLER